MNYHSQIYFPRRAELQGGTSECPPEDLAARLHWFRKDSLIHFNLPEFVDQELKKAFEEQLKTPTLELPTARKPGRRSKPRDGSSKRKTRNVPDCSTSATTPSNWQHAGDDLDTPQQTQPDMSESANIPASKCFRPWLMNLVG